MKKPYEFEIKARYAGLRMSERKVADIYLSWDKDFEELSLAALAEKAGVSQPSVMRFVKAMGFDGFKEFKYAILKARGEQEAIGEDEKNSAGFPPPLVYGYAISEGDSLEEMPGRIFLRPFLPGGYVKADFFGKNSEGGRNDLQRPSDCCILCGKFGFCSTGFGDKAFVSGV